MTILDTDILEPFLLKYFPSVISDDGKIDLPSIVLSWYQNYDEIADFARNNNIQLPNMYQDDKLAMVGQTEWRQLQYRYYIWYIYFDNILSGVSQSSDEVMIALAEIFRWSFVTQGIPGLSVIYRIFRSEDKDDSNSYLKFLKTDYRTLITDVYNVVRGSQVQNKDCFQFIADTNKLTKTYKVLKKGGKGTIEKTEPCNILYYSDYPYQGTKGYVAGGWTANNSIRLISDLESSGKKFIFSCRANISMQDRKAKKVSDEDLNEIKKNNRALKASVFDKFTKAKSVVYIKSLTGVSLAEAIEQSKVTEIMITDFEVESFGEFDKFEFYGYKEFMRILNNNLQV